MNPSTWTFSNMQNLVLQNLVLHRSLCYQNFHSIFFTMLVQLKPIFDPEKLNHISHCFTSRCILLLKVFLWLRFHWICTSSSVLNRLHFKAFFSGPMMWKVQSDRWGLLSGCFNILHFFRCKSLFLTLATWGRSLSWSRKTPRESFLGQQN